MHINACPFNKRYSMNGCLEIQDQPITRVKLNRGEKKESKKEANTIKGLGADHGKAPKKSQHQLKSKASAGYGMNKKGKESF